MSRYALHRYTHISSREHTMMRGIQKFLRREAPDGADFHVGKYPTGHKCQFTREILRTPNLSFEVIVRLVRLTTAVRSVTLPN